MTGKTKASAKINVKSKKPLSKTASKASVESNNVCEAYKSLRTALDGIQYGSMSYYADDTDDTAKIRRAAELDKILTEAYEQIIALSPRLKSDCPPDHLCDGFCLPYPCR